ncbi:4-carboxy-4-hydroxy-2-oxoadipate aldolase/oxaloacetate decarboxylase [Oxalobacteraceae bacterium OTU3CINTB1]|nr:4-carboxy-4-hydroxy-2-oxoadipate aldolase/oxaloacetate decarboxylase [Oxalobacteraceae bacterium OTU3CINTB1]
MSQISPDISLDTLRGLRELGAATVHEAQGGKGALDSGMKPIDAAMRVAGPAFTVDARPADNLMLHYAMLKARPGDVLVVDAKGFLEAGVWGDVFTEQALKMGLAGLVINGAVRDAAAIIAAGFPVFARGLSIKGTGKHQPGRIDVPVVIGDVEIQPGDIVIGDQDGLVVVARKDADAVLAAGRAREAKEAAYRERIRNGATTVDLLDLAETLQRLNLR